MPPVDDEKLQLDEEAPDKLTLDEASPGGEQQQPAGKEEGVGELQKRRAGQSTWEKLKTAVNPFSVSEDLGAVGTSLGRRAEQAHMEDLGAAARGGKPSGLKSQIEDLGARTARMGAGLTSPSSAAIGAGAAIAPEIVGPGLVAHGVSNMWDPGKKLIQNFTSPNPDQLGGGLSPEEAEQFLGGASEAAGGAGATAGAVEGGLGKTTTAKVLDKAVRGTPITEAGKLGAAEQQAMTVKKPAMGELEYANKVHQAIPDLIKIAQDQKGQIDTPRKAAQAISDRVSQIEAPIANHLANLPPSPANMVPSTEYLPTIGTKIMQDLANRPGHFSQTEMAKAGKVVSDFIGDQPKSLEELEGNRRRLNQDADAYFHSDTAGKRAIDVSDATALAQRAAANAIRDILYGDQTGNPGRLERAGVTAVDSGGQQVPIRELRQKVGNLIDVRDHFEDAITKAEAAGDWNPRAVMKSGPSLAMGGVGAAAGAGIGGPFGAVLGLLAGEGVKAWTDYLGSKNTNLNVTKMFRNLGKVSPQPVVEPSIAAPQTSGQPTTGAGAATAGAPATALGPVAPAGGGTPAPAAPMRALPPIGATTGAEAPRPTRLGNIGEERRAGAERRGTPVTEENLPGMVERLKPVGAKETPAFEGTRERLGERRAAEQPEVKHMVKPTETEETRAEAKKKVEKNLEPIEYTKPMPMAPSRLRPEAGTTDVSVHHHELSHAIVGALNGIEPGAIISHRFEGIGKSTAAALFDLKEFKNPDKFTQKIFGPFKRDLAPEKSQALSDLFAAGAAANEVIDGIARDKNVGLSGDKRMAKQLFDALGVPLSKHEELWNSAVDRAKEKLTPEIQDIIKDEATRREDNLPVEYHYSENRVKHIIERVRGLHGQPEQTAIGHEAADIGEGNRGGTENVAGREGPGAQESRSEPAQEKLKPFKPPQNTYHFEVNRPDGSTSTTMLKAIDRKTAFKKLTKQLEDIGGSYDAHFLAEEKPEVGPPTQLEPIPFTELRKNPLLKDAKGEEGRVKVADIGEMIGKYAKKKVGKIGSDAAVDHAVKMAAPEIKYQIAGGNSGLGWYAADTQKAVDAMTEIHPELKDPKKASLFKTFWSALSYGKNPADNMMLAEKAYQLYKDTGKMPITQPGGKAWGVYKAGHEGNLKTTQALIYKHGENGAVDWLLSKHPTSELKEFNKNVAGKADEQQYGAVVYGPKGGNFYLNLNGVPDLVTVDKWMARSWRRWTGTLSGKNVDDAPSPEEIRNTRAAVAKVAGKLKLEPRDAQAVLWYYEQELYKAHGATSEALSYGNEARRIVDQRKAVQPQGNAGKGGGSQIFKKAAKY